MKKLLASLAVASVVITGLSPVASAAQPQFQQQTDHRNDRNDRNDRNGQNDRGRFYEVNGHRYERQAGPAWKAPRGWQNQQFRKGQRLAPEYRRVVVRDYQRYQLAPPSRGYQYVRVNHDVVLTAIGTGLIVAVIAGAFN
jgi:Ni/Co efflux regulator RcnB